MTKSVSVERDAAAWLACTSTASAASSKKRMSPCSTAACPARRAGCAGSACRCWPGPPAGGRPRSARRRSPSRARRRRCVVGASAPRAHRALELGDDAGHVADGDGASTAPTCTMRPCLDAVQPDVAGDGLGAVQVEDEAAVAPAARASALSPNSAACHTCRSYLPRFWTTKGRTFGDRQQPLAGGVDGEAAQVAGDPAPVQLLGHGGGGAAADRSSRGPGRPRSRRRG